MMIMMMMVVVLMMIYLVCGFPSSPLTSTPDMCLWIYVVMCLWSL